MNATLGQLAERIRGELTDLDRAEQRALRAWQQAGAATGERDAYLDSVALNLHGFYSGLERLFSLIATHVDQELPTGEMWHRDLLQRMARDVPDASPSVLSPSTALELDEFLRFRHLVRNVYATISCPQGWRAC